MPGPNDEMHVDPTHKTPRPDWFDEKKVSDLEKTMLPEWFDGSAPHRTPDSYVKVREAIIKLSDKLGTRHVTATMVRRAIPGDAGSLMRMHHFLTTYAVVNEDAINDSMPVPMDIQEDKMAQERKRSWDETLREHLVEAVVQEARSIRAKRSIPATEDFVPIDWMAVAQTVGHGKSARDCEQQFLTMPHLEEKPERPITPDGTAVEPAPSSHVLSKLVADTDPAIIRAVTNAALNATDDWKQAQKAATVGLVASQAAQVARADQARLTHVLNEVVEVRMKKLENRLSMLDDVEGMLEAERVALELERRDLYTARCRHWFQGP